MDRGADRHSQDPRRPGDDTSAGDLGLARLRGVECRAPYAEVFGCGKAMIALRASPERGLSTAVALLTRPLGTSGMDITTVGLGPWAFGRLGWGEQDDRDSIATIRHAAEADINWIDTAAVCGLGHSEKIVATALEGIPAADRPCVFTNAGVSCDPADHTAPARQRMDPAIVRRDVDASLHRLQADSIDLYQVHKPPRDDGTPLEEYWQVMSELKGARKVRAIGLSNHDAPHWCSSVSTWL